MGDVVIGDVGSKAHFRLVRGRPSLTERTDATRTAHGDQREVSTCNVMGDVGKYCNLCFCSSQRVSSQSLRTAEVRASEVSRQSHRASERQRSELQGYRTREKRRTTEPQDCRTTEIQGTPPIEPRL